MSNTNSSSYRTNSRLPSLSRSLNANLDMSSSEFAISVPIVSRNYNNVFGAENFTFNRSELRTPREEREKLKYSLLSKKEKDKKLKNYNSWDISLEEIEAERLKVIENKKRIEEYNLKLLELEKLKANNRNSSPNSIKNDNNNNINSIQNIKLKYNGRSNSNNKLVIMDNINKYDKTKYIGIEAKKEFQLLYRKANRDFSIYVKDEDVPEAKRTPRSLYLREIEKNKLLPLSIILRKEKFENGIYLANRGLGDLHIAPLVEMIHTLPNIDTVDLNDNRLTDITLMPLMLKLVNMPSLTHLDLSNNKMDDSSEVIMEYIKANNCSLVTLILNGADVDDGEAGNLADAISVNTSITTLCLSHNLLGKEELASMNNSNIITGGVAIGKMLEVNRTLTKLDLSWNAIRLNSAEKFATSLKKNSVLKELYLGHNGFGDNATQIIGRTLKSNISMEAIDLSYNSLHPQSIAVLANSLVFNEAMSFINLDGNILGRVGTQAMVAAIQRASGKVRSLHISFNDCDCRKNEPGLFDPANPAGEYEVDLSTPYGVMVVDEAFYLANYRAGVSLTYLEYKSNEFFHVIRLTTEITKINNGKFNPDEFKKLTKLIATLIQEGKRKELEASENLCKLLNLFTFNISKTNALQAIRIIKTQWDEKVTKHKLLGIELSDQLHEILLFEIFFALFIANDEDCSGTIDADEFVNTLNSLGMNITKDTAIRLMSEFDKDKSGSIDANEFSTILVNEYCRTEAPRGRIIDASTGKPWNIPHFGIARLKIDCICDAPSIFDVGEDSGVESIIQAMKDAKTEEQKLLIFEQAVQSPYHFMTEIQGQMLLDELAGTLGKRSAKNAQIYQIIASILPQLVTSEHCTKLIEHNLDDQGKLELRLLMGDMFNALIGFPTGHYSFDMKKSSHRQFARKLAAIANTETKFCKSVNCNTSQYGDYSHFRNERLDNSNIRITPQWVVSCNPTGNLSFDFISTTKSKQGQKGLPSHRFEKLLLKLKLNEIDIRQNEINIALAKDEKYLQEIEMKQKSIDSTNDSDRRRSILTRTPSIVGLSKMRMAMRSGGSPLTLSNGVSPMQSYKDLNLAENENDLNRTKFINSGKLNITINEDKSNNSTPNFNSGSNTPVNTYATNSFNYTKLSNSVEIITMQDIILPFTFTIIRDAYTEYINSCHLWLDVYPPERPRDFTGHDTAIETPRDFKLAEKPDRTNFPPIYPLAYRKLILLQIELLAIHLTVEQAATIIKFFPSIAFLRVQAFLCLFNCIIDFDNLPLIIDKIFNESERYEAIHRLGILNLYDSFYPDRHYRLDLRRWDHREWAKILVTLAMTEPGDNWENQAYRWSKFDEIVPGWELPQVNYIIIIIIFLINKLYIIYYYYITFIHNLFYLM